MLMSMKAKWYGFSDSNQITLIYQLFLILCSSSLLGVDDRKNIYLFAAHVY